MTTSSYNLHRQCTIQLHCLKKPDMHINVTGLSSSKFLLLAPILATGNICISLNE